MKLKWIAIVVWLIGCGSDGSAVALLDAGPDAMDVADDAGSGGALNTGGALPVPAGGSPSVGGSGGVEDSGGAVDAGTGDVWMPLINIPKPVDPDDYDLEAPGMPCDPASRCIGIGLFACDCTFEALFDRGCPSGVRDWAVCTTSCGGGSLSAGRHLLGCQP